MHAKHCGRLTAMHSGLLTAMHSGRRNGSKILLSEPNIYIRIRTADLLTRCVSN